MSRLRNTTTFILLASFLSFSNQTLYSQNSSAKNKILSINGYLAGKIPISIIKKATHLDIKPPYTLISSTVYFSSHIGGDTNMTFIKGSVFDKNFLQLWSRVSVNTIITFDNIKVLQDGKVLDLIGASFQVIED